VFLASIGTLAKNDADLREASHGIDDLVRRANPGG
jgi:hypothetical protein